MVWEWRLFSLGQRFHVTAPSIRLTGSVQGLDSPSWVLWKNGHRGHLDTRISQWTWNKQGTDGALEWWGHLSWGRRTMKSYPCPSPSTVAWGRVWRKGHIPEPLLWWRFLQCSRQVFLRTCVDSTYQLCLYTWPHFGMTWFGNAPEEVWETWAGRWVVTEPLSRLLLLVVGILLFPV